MIKRMAFVVGHKPASPGAVHPAGEPSEYQFNDRLARDVRERLIEADAPFETLIIYRQPGIYRELPDKINANEPAFIVSLHCNASETHTATGSEVLYYHKSTRGRALAEIVQRELVAALDLRDRGIKPRDVEQRGGYLLCYTRMPAVIAEPFFIDNDEDLARARSRYNGLVGAYERAVRHYAEALTAADCTI